MKLLVACSVVVAMCSSVAAAPEHEDHQEKNDAVPVGLTVAGTIAPFAIMAYGTTGIDEGGLFGIGMLLTIPGPAIGHWYTQHSGWRGMVTRLGGFLAIMVGFSEIDDAKRCARGEMVTDGCESVSRNLGIGFIATGLAAYAGSIVYDAITSRREVHRYNERIHVTPLVVPQTHGATVGIGVAF